MLVVPAAIAVIKPEATPTVAIAGELLVHNPPAGEADNVPVSPIQ
jgi:hypothetical protein